jgi:hypothetical protein
MYGDDADPGIGRYGSTDGRKTSSTASGHLDVGVGKEPNLRRHSEGRVVKEKSPAYAGTPKEGW